MHGAIKLMQSGSKVENNFIYRKVKSLWSIGEEKKRGVYLFNLKKVIFYLHKSRELAK